MSEEQLIAKAKEVCAEEYGQIIGVEFSELLPANHPYVAERHFCPADTLLVGLYYKDAESGHIWAADYAVWPDGSKVECWAS